MKPQAGMAFEYDDKRRKIKGRIVEVNNNFYIRYLNDFKEITTEPIPTRSFRIIPITLDLLQVGDVIIRGSTKCKVLGRINEIIFVSFENNYNEICDIPYLIEELKSRDYTVIQPKWEEEIKDTTISENIKGLIKVREILDEFIYKNPSWRKV